MYVRSLELANFRNFRRLALELADGPTIIRGDNGQGKTNLLEAVELLATAKSARAGAERELIHWAMAEPGAPEPFARIRAAVVRQERELRAEVLVRLEGSAQEGGPITAAKTFRLNGLSRRALEFVGAVNAVSFSPLDVGLVSGPPGGRRRYLDVMISQANARYLYALQRYTKVLLQRNHLLRQLRNRGRDPDATLGVWTDQLASDGALLMLERARTVRDLAGLADQWFQQLAGSSQHLGVSYQPSFEAAAAADMAAIPEASSPEGLRWFQVQYVEALRRAEARELAAGVSLIGPHRDDLRLSLDGADLHVYGSRGQQRLAALSLKLAEADLLEARAGSRPILLLDDVLSELDKPRQAAVLELVKARGQSLLTVTSLELVDPRVLPSAPVFHVEDGAVTMGSRG